jgi:exosortase A
VQKTLPTPQKEAPGAEHAPATAVERSSPAQHIEPPPVSGTHAYWRRDWARSLVLFAVCSILLIWAFRSEIGAAIDVWSSSRTFGHAFFIFPILVYLFYRLRHQLVTLEPRPAPWALLLIAGAMVLWTVGELANLMVIKQFVFVIIWQSLFLLVFGWNATKSSIFPLAYLYLAIPFGISVIPALQHITAQIVVHLLRLSAVPVFLEGYFIEIPSGSFLVAEACSGVRYLMVCIALGILAAHLFFRSWPRRILFVALSVLVPVVANGVRAYGVVMIAHYGRHDVAINFDHVVYGFIFLSVVTMTLLGIGALLRDGHLYPSVGTANLTAASPRAGVPNPVGARRFIQPLWAVLAAAIVFSIHFWTDAVRTPPTTAEIVRAPITGSSWIPEAVQAAWAPVFHGTDAWLEQGYRRAAARVDLHVGYYAYQREGAEAVSDLNTMSGPPEVKVLSSGQATVQTANATLPVNEIVVLYQGKTFLVWYWYWIGGENTNSRMTGKLQEMKAIATGGERAAAVVAVSAEVLENAEGTAALLSSFLQENIGSDGTLFHREATPAPSAISEPQPQPMAGDQANP